MAQDATPRVRLAQGAPALRLPGEGAAFSGELILDFARQLSRRPFVPLAATTDLPEPFATLSSDQLATIRAKPGAVIWAGESRGFTIEPLHRGGVFSMPVTLCVVEDGLIRRVTYEASKFEFGRVAPPQTQADIGFSGFRIAAGAERSQELAIFQGATFFRAIARGQNFGLVARSLILRPGEARGEDVPFFRAFWIERPTALANALVIHGLFDSESTVGITRITLRPGDISFADVETTLFARENLDHVGLGCLTGTFLSGPQNRRSLDDIRPGVYEISGLQIRTGAGEPIYRPLNNPTNLQVSSFVDRNIRGFGLVQRDRDYAAFQDDEQRFELRPSVWIQPLGEWGEGSVQLIEIPSESEANDNIIAYWRPRQQVPAGSETNFAYRQAWCWYPPDNVGLATVTRIRQGRGSQGRRRRYTVDFSGDRLGDPSVVTAVRAALSATPGTVSDVRLWPYPERKTLRVSFELDPGNENVSEMRLVLQVGGNAVSETWLNRWTP